MRVSKKELEQLPEYFKYICFERRTTVIKSLDLIGESSLNLDKCIRKCNDYDDKSLVELLKEGKFNKRTKEELISLGKKLKGMIDCCNLDDRYINIRNDRYKIIIDCKLKNGESATITVGNRDCFDLIVDNKTIVYDRIHDNVFKDLSQYDGYYSHYYDSSNEISFIETSHIQEEKMGDQKECQFESHVSSIVGCSKYLYLLSDKQKKIRLKTEIFATSLDFDEEGLFSHIKNLQLPVDIFSYLSDIGEKFSLKKSVSGKRLIIQYNNNNYTNDSIEIVGISNSLKNLEATDSSDTKESCLIIDGIDTFDYKVNIEEGYNKLKYNVRKNKNGRMIVNLESQGEYMLDRVNGTDIKEEATEAYQKILKKLPGWVKIN